jgi:hypothetical protein
MVNKVINPKAVMQCNSPVDGDVVPALIVGSAGETYHGREVIVFRHPAGLFGTRMVGNDRWRKFTLCKGIVNQCVLSEPPSPYWAVLDAMSEFKEGFTRGQVIERAVVTVGEASRRACELAWDVLRNHHRHARKKDAGMTYMIDSLTGGKLAIRARGADETLQYFEAEGLRRKTAEVLATGSAEVVPVVEPGVVEPVDPPEGSALP